jgi:hypothetical protein
LARSLLHCVRTGLEDQGTPRNIWSSKSSMYGIWPNAPCILLDDARSQLSRNANLSLDISRHPVPAQQRLSCVPYLIGSFLKNGHANLFVEPSPRLAELFVDSPPLLSLSSARVSKGIRAKVGRCFVELEEVVDGVFFVVLRLTVEDVRLDIEMP